MDREREICLALRRSDTERVRTLLESGCDVNFVTPRGNTYLHLAKTADVTKLLLVLGANVNALNYLKLTPLNLAVIKKKPLPLIRALLAFGANVNQNIGISMSLAMKRKNVDLILEFLNCDNLAITPRMFEFLIEHKYGEAIKLAFERYEPLAKRKVKRLILESMAKSEKEQPDLKGFKKSFLLINHIDECRREIDKFKCQDFGGFMIKDLNDLSEYTTEQLIFFRHHFKKMKNEYPIYGRCIRKLFKSEIESRTSLEQIFKSSLSL